LDGPGLRALAHDAVALMKVGPDGGGHGGDVGAVEEALETHDAVALEGRTLFGGELECGHVRLRNDGAPRRISRAGPEGSDRSIHRGAVPRGSPQGAVNDGRNVASPPAAVNGGAG